MVRLTFVGDIALDKPLLKAARARGRGKFDFSDVFHTAEVFADSDLVIGNLETCFGGGKRFNRKPFHYNSPDAFCTAIREAGIGLVSTANNHCMDEGVPGLKRTLRLLDAQGISHTGTFCADEEERFLIREIRGLNIAFLSMTYSVNACMESLSCPDLFRYVNLTGFARRKAPKWKQLVKYVVMPRVGKLRRKLQKRSTISAHTDAFQVKQINPNWMAELERQLRRAKEQADLVVVLLHSGGQFNLEPGEYSKYMMVRLCELGADVVIGNHPHTVQRVERRGDKIVAYSLGGYCMSVSGEYLVHDCLPEYSLALHLDVDEKSGKFDCKIDVLKGSEDQTGYLNVKLANDDGAAAIYERCGQGGRRRV